MSSINDFYSYCYYCSYTRESLCYSDKKCLVCSSYYLLDTILYDGDGKHDILVPVLRNGMMGLCEWHVRMSLRVKCDGR